MLDFSCGCAIIYPVSTDNNTVSSVYYDTFFQRVGTTLLAITLTIAAFISLMYAVNHHALSPRESLVYAGIIVTGAIATVIFWSRSAKAYRNLTVQIAKRVP